MDKLSKLFRDRTIQSQEEVIEQDEALSVLNQLSEDQDIDNKDDELGEIELLNMNICHSLSIDSASGFQRYFDQVKMIL